MCYYKLYCMGVPCGHSPAQINDNLSLPAPGGVGGWILHLDPTHPPYLPGKRIKTTKYYIILIVIICIQIC